MELANTRDTYVDKQVYATSIQDVTLTSHILHSITVPFSPFIDRQKNKTQEALVPDDQ